MGKAQELEVYFAEAASWDAGREAARAHSERIAWRVATAACLASLLMGASLVALVPLHRVETALVRVDARTGVIDVVPRYEATGKVDELVTRYLLGQCVHVCEQFYFASALNDYETCGAFNSAARNQDLYQRWTPANPQSPLTLYRDGTTLRTQVASITFLGSARGSGSQLAQVRYQVGKRAGGTGPEALTYWIGTLEYAYVAPSRDARTRALNPLGLQVLDWRREAEVPESAPGRAGRAVLAKEAP